MTLEEIHEIMDSPDFKREYEEWFDQKHIFSNFDKKRNILGLSDRMRVLCRPMYIQITSDGVVKFKRDAQGRYYIFGWEEDYADSENA
jgi:hypothetical protein